MDNFNEEEIEWLRMATRYNSYHIEVDNDCVWIEQYHDDDYGQWTEEVFTFDDYGQDFIVKLLNYIGCYAEPC